MCLIYVVATAFLHLKIFQHRCFFFLIYEIFKDIYFEEHLQTTAFSSSSFKLDLVHLTVFPDFKPFATVCISKILCFCCQASSSLFYQV